MQGAAPRKQPPLQGACRKLLVLHLQPRNPCDLCLTPFIGLKSTQLFSHASPGLHCTVKHESLCRTALPAEQ